MMKTVLVLIISVAQASMLAGTADVTSETWEPPIGIPVPSFGIEETYRMYDEESARNPALTYKESESGGYYTHYVDWTADSATDSGNPNGSIARPRRTIPQNLPAGSILEIHGGPYAGGRAPYGNNYFYITGSGTAERPIFVRGVGKPIFHHMFGRFAGRYLIIEGFEYLDTTLTSWGDAANPNGSYISIRNNEIHGSDAPSGRAVSIGTSNDIVIYNNHIHHNGLIPYGDGHDFHGLAVTGTAQKIWIVDNNINSNDGDSIQIDDGPGGIGTIGVYPSYIYIGRNKLYNDRENAIDLKYCKHIIVSQNEIYGYNTNPRVFGCDPNPRDIHGSDGAAILPCNEGGMLSWFIFNDIHDNRLAFRLADEEDVSPHDIYMVGNLIHRIEGQGFFVYSKQNDYVVANTVYDVGVGFWSYNGSNASEGESKHGFYNNVFCKINGGYSDRHRTYPDDYIFIGNSSSANKTYVENNIFYAGGGYHWGSSNNYDTIGILAHYEPDQVKGCIETNPLFVDPENGDFRLLPESPINTMETSEKTQAVFDLFLQLYGIDLVGDIEGIERISSPPVIPDAENTGDTSSSASTPADTAEEQTTVSVTADTGSSDSATPNVTVAETTTSDNGQTNDPVPSESTDTTPDTQEEQTAVSKTEDTVRPTDTTSTQEKQEEETANTDSENNKKKTITVFKGRKVRMWRIYEKSEQLYLWEASGKPDNNEIYE
jgi:hypothetical protein